LYPHRSSWIAKAVVLRVSALSKWARMKRRKPQSVLSTAVLSVDAICASTSQSPKPLVAAALAVAAVVDLAADVVAAVVAAAVVAAAVAATVVVAAAAVDTAAAVAATVVVAAAAVDTAAAAADLATKTLFGGTSSGSLAGM
jgi:hypothetical protein